MATPRPDLPPPGVPVGVPPGVPVVELAQVTKRYRGGGGIAEVDLEVHPGEVLAFLGPNGAGKTTTLRLLLDLIRPDAGTIRLFGRDPRTEGVAVRRRIGYLPGDLGLYDRLTGRELLVHFARLRNGPPWAAIAALAERLELDLDRPIRSLSKGNRQKVGLAQAFMGAPDLLVLDEPTSGLDPLVQHEVLAMIREVAESGRSVLLSSHVLSEVAQVADRVAMIKEGRVLKVERVEDLRARSVHYVTVRFAAGASGGGGDEAASGAEDLRGLSGCVVREHDGVIHLEVSGPVDPLVAVLARHHLAELVVREPSLEELFLGAYGLPRPPASGNGGPPG